MSFETQPPGGHYSFTLVFVVIIYGIMLLTYMVKSIKRSSALNQISSKYCTDATWSVSFGIRSELGR